MIKEAKGTSDELVRTITYDAVGNVTSEKVAGIETKFWYDDLNRATTITEAYGTSDAQTMTYVYDKVGNETSRTVNGVRTDTTYDKLYRVKTVTQKPVSVHFLVDGPLVCEWNQKNELTPIPPEWNQKNELTPIPPPIPPLNRARHCFCGCKTRSKRSRAG